jgi:hypothetical protein
MVEDARGHDFVECDAQVADAIDRHLMDFETGRLVLAREILVCRSSSR